MEEDEEERLERGCRETLEGEEERLERSCRETEEETGKTAKRVVQ